MGMAGAAVEFSTPWLAIVCAGVWATSLWWYGRRFTPE
jgi:hypothetical protein